MMNRTVRPRYGRLVLVGFVLVGEDDEQTVGCKVALNEFGQQLHLVVIGEGAGRAPTATSRWSGRIWSPSEATSVQSVKLLRLYMKLNFFLPQMVLIFSMVSSELYSSTRQLRFSARIPMASTHCAKPASNSALRGTRMCMR